MSETNNTLKNKIKSLEKLRNTCDTLGYVGVFVPLLIVGCAEVGDITKSYQVSLSTGMWLALMTCSCIALFEIYLLANFKEYADEIHKELFSGNKNFAGYRTNLLYQQVFFLVIGVIIISIIGVGVFSGMCFGFAFTNFFYMGYITEKEIEFVKQNLSLEG
jgi:hypothetical protein